jgi:GNAT superfamily N-acetyltransferase
MKKPLSWKLYSKALDNPKMSEILEDLSSPALIHAIEANIFEMIQLFRGWPQAEMHDDPDLLWTITSIPFPLFNSVLRAQIAPEAIDATLDRAITRYRSRNMPMLWWTGPATQPADLGVHLERHGLIDEGQMPGMAIDLAELNESLPMPAGLTIQRVADSETLNLWNQICATGFEMPGFVGEAFFDLMNSMEPEAMLPYLGRLNGKPVATSLLYIAAGVAGIYNVATLPEARRLGIGAAMTVAPLKDARDMGYKAGILQASRLGAGVYESLGFREYCKIGQYVWLPDHEQA